jgi:hypothetical protein
MFASDYQEGQIAGLFPNPVYIMPTDAFPGEDGTGGTNMAAARTSVAMAAVSGSSRASSAQVEITLNASGRVRFFKVYDAASGGNFLAYAPLGANQPQGFQLTDTTNDDFVCVGHGFSAGDEVFFVQEFSAKSLPGGITAGTPYYVISAGLTANAFRVSTTPGGAAVNVSAAGAGLVCRTAAVDMSSGQILRIAAGDLIFTGF